MVYFLSLSVTNKITPDVLFREAVLVTPRKKNVTFVPLMDTELPKAETVVGLDTEFVTLNQVCDGSGNDDGRRGAITLRTGWGGSSWGSCG